jgi:hypothetical protein
VKRRYGPPLHQAAATAAQQRHRRPAVRQAGQVGPRGRCRAPQSSRRKGQQQPARQPSSSSSAACRPGSLSTARQAGNRAVPLQQVAAGLLPPSCSCTLSRTCVPCSRLRALPGLALVQVRRQCYSCPHLPRACACRRSCASRRSSGRSCQRRPWSRGACAAAASTCEHCLLSAARRPRASRCARMPVCCHRWKQAPACATPHAIHPAAVA